MTSEESTSYANPMSISQCTSYKGEKFSSWSGKRLGTVKADELNKKGKQWDLSAVAYKVSSTRKSALMYAYNFGFNIPLNSKITKVIVKQVFCGDNNTNGRAKTYLVKLKTGASTNDTGVGNNKSDNVKWRTHSYAHRNGMQYSYIGDTTQTVKEFWGVDLTPSTVNNSDFGCVVQANATTKSGHKLYLDNIQMKVYYTKDETTTTTDELTYENDIKVKYAITNKKQDQLTIDPDTKAPKIVTTLPLTQAYDNPKALKFYVRYSNMAGTDSKGKNHIVDVESDELYLVTDENLLFQGAVNKIKISKKKLKGTTNKKYLDMKYIWYYFEHSVYINPKVYLKMQFEDEITSKVTLYKMKIDDEHKIGSLTFNITQGNSDIPYSQTIIKNCEFVDNTANKGSAIYNTGRIYTYNNRFQNNYTIDSNGALQKNKCQFFDVNLCRVPEDMYPPKIPTFPTFERVDAVDDSVTLDVAVHSSDNRKVSGKVEVDINKR